MTFLWKKSITYNIYTQQPETSNHCKTETANSFKRVEPTRVGDSQLYAKPKYRIRDFLKSFKDYKEGRAFQNSSLGI